MSEIRILLIEDEKVVSEFASLTLGSMGMQVDVAASVAEARQITGSGARFSLAICDIELPDGDGLELARQIADEGVTGHVMLSSGWPEEYEDHPCLHDPRFSFLPKPYGMQQLKDSVSRLVGA